MQHPRRGHPAPAAALLAAVLLAAALPRGTAVAVRATSEAVAVAWLRAHHNAPQPDELAELKDVNPDAYAIVKALLTKRALGLLDPKHPSASFAGAGPPPQAAQDGEPSGPAAFQRIAEESGEPVAKGGGAAAAPVVYPDVPAAPAHHDWLSWKPQQSALDDESMVKSVLGAVAELKAGGGGALRGRGAGEARPADDDGEPSLTWKSNSVTSPAADAKPAARAAPAAPAVPAPPAADTAKPIAAMSQENSYLKGIDFGLGAAAARPEQPVEENSYLKGMDLTAGLSAPAAGAAARARPVGLSSVKAKDSRNYLAGFSWDDDAPKAAATAGPAQQRAAASAAGAAGQQRGSGAAPKAPKSALFAWLSGDKPPKKAAEPRHQAAPAAQRNAYLSDLQ